MKEEPRSVLLEIARMASSAPEFRSDLQTEPVATLSNLGVELSEDEAKLVHSISALANGRLLEAATEPDIPFLWGIAPPITLAALRADRA